MSPPRRPACGRAVARLAERGFKLALIRPRDSPCARYDGGCIGVHDWASVRPGDDNDIVAMCFKCGWRNCRRVHPRRCSALVCCALCGQTSHDTRYHTEFQQYVSRRATETTQRQVEAAAAQPVVATVWPRGPNNLMEGPVSSVPNVDAQPAAAANLPHCAAPHCRSSRAKTCQKSPSPFVSDCKSTTAFKRANRGPLINNRLKAKGWNAGGRFSVVVIFEAGRVSGAEDTNAKTQHIRRLIMCGAFL